MPAPDEAFAPAPGLRAAPVPGAAVVRQASGSAESLAASTVCRLTFLYFRRLVLMVLVQVFADWFRTGQMSAVVS